MKNSKIFSFVICVVLTTSCSINNNQSDWDTSINFGWKFAKGDNQDAIEINFDDSAWESVDLPHDWAISGPFGELDEPGGTGKLPWKGEGWYRKTIDLPANAKEKRLQFLFDGVMASPEVYLNGQKVGSWIYGYNSFWMDATDAAKFGQKNVLTIHADTREHYSRWYPGAGIYRKISMRLVEPVHIPVWGVYVTTPMVSRKKVNINSKIDIENASDKSKKITLVVSILNPDSEEVKNMDKEITMEGNSKQTFDFNFEIGNPVFWDTESPELYICKTELKSGNKVIQSNETNFGVRTFEWTANDGFHLNGRRVQIHGVNLHHDHGPLGAAFYPRAMERQLEIMKDMGVNSIRTSHNAPAPELLDLCDKMGLIVYNELFDKYDATAGVQCSTGEYVKQYAEKEVKNFVLRDRNHPCVFMWSIGNEISDILTNRDGEAPEHVAKMVEYFKNYDDTRPTSMGCHIASASVGDKKILDALETTGWNYGRRYYTTRKAYPNMPLLYTESASAFGTRGDYKLEFSKNKIDWGNDGKISEYMLTSAPWSDIPEIEFEYMRTDTFVAGEYVWTGFDYLGEPTPFVNGRRFTSRKDGAYARSSYFGIVDLAGLPKNSFYNYRSLWNTKENTVHLTPHWNWEGYEGKKIPVLLYTNGDEAELFLNGKSLGKKKKKDFSIISNSQKLAEDPDYIVKLENSKDSYYDAIDAYRLRWMDVPYERGELKAVAYNKGKKIGEDIIISAGKPAKLQLQADRKEIKADGMDLCYITIEMIDNNGTLCPRAMDKLNFKIEGCGKFMGVANGDQMGLDVFTDLTHPLFFGKAVAVIKSIKGQTGECKLTVGTDEGKESIITINSK